MSSATDILIYCSPADRDNMAALNELIAADARFEAHPWPVDKDKFSGPNVFYGDVWAFGADYYLADDLQESVDKIRWKHPELFVAVVNWHDGMVPQVEIVRPRYRMEELNAYYGEYRFVQEGFG